MKSMLTTMAAGVAVGLSLVGFAGPNIIFDTDMVIDFDDVGAMATLHALADRGECNILAMATCSRDNQSVAAVEILNAFYGRADIPVGCTKEIGVVGDPEHADRSGHAKYTQLAKEYPEWVKHPNSNDAPDANEVYRKALAAAPDRSVVVCSVGFTTNLRRLLETKGDKYSKLDGRALVAKKVQRWVAMACKGPKGREFNSGTDAESSKIAFENWPTPIVFSDFDYGRSVYSGRGVAERTYAYRNPVKDIFSRCLPSREQVRSGKCWMKEEGGHCSWDEVTVLASVRQPQRYFELERGTYRMVGDKGEDEWIPDPNSRDCRLADKYPKSVIGTLLDDLIASEPKCRRADVIAHSRQRCEKTPTGVRLAKDGKTIWNFEIDTPEGRPYIHPMLLPSGAPLTDVRPKDHVWHLGCWFSWKFINGVNYWEPADEKRQGCEPAGRTRVTKKSIDCKDDACTVRLSLEYGPRAEKNPVLIEERTVVFDPPDPKGGYTVTFRHHFKALADATLDRTPPHGSTEKGKWGGGYAGFTMRLDPSAAQAFTVRGFGGGATPAAVSGTERTYLDFVNPANGEGFTLTQLAGPETARFYTWPDKRMVNPSPVFTGSLTLKKGETLNLAYRVAVHADRMVKGALTARPVEKMDRGLTPVVTERGTYVSWRLLDTDASNAAFDLWRKCGEKVEKLNAAPITQTTDFFCADCFDEAALYSLDGKNWTPVRSPQRKGSASYIRIPLAETNATVAAVGVGDLDGDGAYDYVIKTPRGGTDPWDLVWHPAKDTYKMQAYTSTGKFLWSKEQGWNIEMGIWYSPFIVVDLDGDGKAEVVTKTAPLTPDYRDASGRVMKGPEWLTVIDGLTGRELAKAPWVERGIADPVDDYNHFSSRNQIALAYLDGKTPCIIVERGTYGHMVVDAYKFEGGKLARLWRFDNKFMPGFFKGQGDHACLCEDVDGDGFDEVLIGSLTLDQDGTVLWCNGRGHSDAHYYGDIDPDRPGMELAFVYETRQHNGGGLLLTDPVTGEDIWKLPTRTRHVHGCGICADIAPEHHGLEIYGQEVDQGNNSKTNTHPKSDNRWFYTASGTLLCAYTNCVYGYGNGVRNAYWDADLQREIFGGGLKDHDSAGRVSPRLPSPMLVADLFGDWREEFIAAAPGELRIYTTDIPAMDRRVTLMRDRPYRSRILMTPSGYEQQPILSYVPSAVDPNVSLRMGPLARTLRIDVTAPKDKPLKGTLSVVFEQGWKVDLGDGKIDVPANGHWTKTFKINRKPNPSGRYDATATLMRENVPALILHQPFYL